MRPRMLIMVCLTGPDFGNFSGLGPDRIKVFSPTRRFWMQEYFVNIKRKMKILPDYVGFGFDFN